MIPKCSSKLFIESSTVLPISDTAFFTWKWREKNTELMVHSENMPQGYEQRIKQKKLSSNTRKYIYNICMQILEK